MPKPLAVNAAILLTDCTEFDGPLLFFSGSHKECADTILVPYMLFADA